MSEPQYQEQNTEQDFLEDDTHRIILSLGSKGSGKTHMMINYLKWALMNMKYAEYHLVLPAYKNEKDGQYGFLKGMKNVFIYNTYNPKICSRIKKPNTLFIIDDATSNGLDIKKDMNLMKIITTSRHCKIQLWLIFHAVRSIMSVPVRANIDYLFVHKTTNRKLLEAIFSMYPEFDREQTFINFYHETVLSQQYNALFLNLVKGQYDTNVNQWQLNQLHDQDIRPPKNKTSSKSVNKNKKLSQQEYRPNVRMFI